MRLQDESIPGEFKLNSYVQEKQTESISLKNATSLYLNQKGKDRSVSFKRGVERAVGYVMKHLVISILNTISVQMLTS